MPSRLHTGKKLVGVKQSRRAIKNGEAAVVYIAEDAELRIKAPICDMCSQMQIELVHIDSMTQLGQFCGIDVGAAVAVLLK